MVPPIPGGRSDRLVVRGDRRATVSELIGKKLAGTGPFYGVLLAPTLVLAIYADNHASPDHLYRPLAASLLVSVAAVGVLGISTRRWHAASFFVSLAILLAAGLDQWIWALLVPWMFLFGRAWLRKEPLGVVPQLTRPLNVIVAVWLAIAAIGAIAVSLPPDLLPTEPVAVSPGPNVYVVLLDGYPRADSLQEYFEFDNRPFLEALEDRGFNVATRSTGLYESSIQVLPTMLQMRPLRDLLGEEWDGSDAQHRLLWHYLNASPVMAGYGAAGYKTHWIVSPAPALDMRSADVVVESPWFSSFEWHLVDRGVLRAVVPLRAMYRASILDAFRYLEESVGSSPRFVFAHILSPHDPYVFTADGGPAEWCGEECANHVGPPNPTLADRFIGQLRFINTRVLEALDHVIEKDPDAIVIVMSDHGLRRDPADMDEWFRTLFAARGRDFPDDVTTHEVFPTLLGK